jgi:hypothetical protein
MSAKKCATIKVIFKENWPDFKQKHSGRIRKTVIEDVEKMLRCGDISCGYSEYKCDCCGEIKKVAFTCKSRFCSSCGKIYVDKRAENMTNKLIKVKHRHMVFTIPEELRVYFLRERGLLSLLAQESYEVLKRYYEKMNKSKKFRTGMVCVIHTFGRDLKWNPHVHCLVPEGCQSKDGKWKQNKFFPYKLLRKSWQKAILSALEKQVNKGKKNYERIKNKLYAKYQEGFYVYGKGEVVSAKAATNYVGRYTGRPAISNSRIVSYDGETVTIWYKDHESGEKIEETMDVEEFIKRTIRHIPERQFKMVRYYGIYSSNTTRRPLVVKMVHEKIKEVREKYQNWRSRLRLYYGYDPLKCEKCGGEMSLSDIIYPRIGSVMKLYEARELRKEEEELQDLKSQYYSVKCYIDNPLFVGGR